MANSPTSTKFTQKPSTQVKSQKQTEQKPVLNPDTQAPD